MSPKLSGAILKTVLYSDIFDYPLTVFEIHKYLIGQAVNLHPTGGRMDSRRVMDDISKEINKIPIIKQQHGFYFLKGNENSVKIRLKKEVISMQKLKLARNFARMLFFLPSVKVIYVTGSLALLSSAQNDDIDLLIVTSGNRIWSTRFVCVLFLKIIGIYRKPGIKSAPDKICLNMYISEDNLTLPKQEQDLFSAHEIVQAKEIFTRQGYENILLRANPWIRKYLPNISIQPSHSFSVIPSAVEGSRAHARNKNSVTFDLLENLLKSFQLFYMRRRRTTEVIRDGYLRFHPRDARQYILAEYEKKLKKYHTSEV